MFIANGDFSIRVDQWDSREEMFRHLSNAALPNINFLTDSANRVRCFTVTVHKEAPEFILAVCLDNIGLEPGLLLDYKNRNIVLGFGEDIVLFNIVNRTIVAEHSFPGSCFYQFITLNHIAVTDYFLVLCEISVSAITYEGQKLWQYDTNDIISHVSISDGIVKLGLFEGDSKSISIADGSQII